MSSPLHVARRSVAFVTMALLAGCLMLGLWVYWAYRPATELAATNHPGHPDEGTPSNVRLSGEPITPLVPPVVDPLKAALGEKLFHDTRLSHDNSIACASCHALDKGGVDGRAHSVGINGQVGTVNAPTVFNSGFNFRQFWDGRAASLEEQAAGPVHNPIEMGSSWAEVLPRLAADKVFAAEFARAYPGSEGQGGLSGPAIQDAIATFERTLVTPGRFDRWLRGDAAALSAREISGYRLFKSFGCASCHQGMNVGGNIYATLGVFGDFFRNRGKDAKEDQGRFNVTGKEADRHVFKVPGLRNVALTGPYFHDGSITSLEQSIGIMGKYQLGRDLSDAEIDQMKAFLTSLTGSWPGRTP